jgi:hypothetical protein
VLWRRLEGYIVVPWADEHGRPLTLYSRWPAKVPPLMKDLPAWTKKRAEQFAAWEAAADGKPWQEPRVFKTFALSGKDTKAVPYCLDRARRAGHRELVLVEGIFDAALLQVRGETRAVASVAAQLSGEQGKTLQRCRVQRVYVCGDPDGGGDRGTLANVEALTGAGIEAFVVPRLPDELDPDEFVLSRSIEAWRVWVDGSEHALEYRARLLLETHRPAGGAWTAPARESLLDEACAVAAKLPAGRAGDLERYFWLRLAAALGEDVHALRRRFREHCACSQGDGKKAGSGFRWAPIDSATFAQLDCRPRWLVRRLLVRDQPAIAGGPKKVLKTSMLVDLAVSLATGTFFLGEFSIPAPVRVALLSGESGQHTLQETARRVCLARGLTLDQVGDRLLWMFELPQLSAAGELAEMTSGLAADGVEVLLFDPLYLALLAGSAPGAIKTENLFEMGPLLLRITKACLHAGVTPILTHHTTKGKVPGAPLDLEDLAYAGLAEFARQWLLLSRREKYEPGTGQHKLWLQGGGSAGHGGLWSIDIDEGVVDEEFGGRKWDVAVRTGSEERKAEAEHKEDEKETKRRRLEQAEETRLLAALDQLDPNRQGVSYQRVKDLSNLKSRMSPTFERLLANQVVDRIEGLLVQAGNGAQRPAKGIRRRDREGNQHPLTGLTDVIG